MDPIQDVIARVKDRLTKAKGPASDLEHDVADIWERVVTSRKGQPIGQTKAIVQFLDELETWIDGVQP
jgi:hypothetical protein